MATIKDDDDITEEEYTKYLLPYINNFNDYMIRCIIPEVFAFQLANSYFRDCLGHGSLEQHFNSMCDVFNGFSDSMKAVVPATKDILRIKYHLKIVEEDPVKIRKWQ